MATIDRAALPARTAAAPLPGPQPRPRPRAGISLFALALALGLAAPFAAARAQTLADRFAAASSGGDKTPMNVDANQVTYNDKTHTVVATGDVQIYYKKKILEADKVTYFRDTGRVLAEGSVKLTDADGSVTHADRMELSGDFKRGFVDRTRADTNDKTHMTATRTEKLDEETTVFEKGSYTACESCAEHPERPPVWRLRAQKIIHKNAEQTLYYESATFDLFGFPIAWFPFLSTPDPSVTHASGFLAPRLSYNALTTGFSVGQPYFWAIAPDKDLTITPYYYANQGFRGDLEYRQRLDNGYFTLDLTGIRQATPSAFATNPWGAGGRVDRGMVQSQGAIWLSQNWKFGWDIARASDKWFNNDYQVGNTTLNGNFFRENSSTVYLTGQGDRGYFDLRGFSFQGLANTDYQPQLAAVWPMLDYNKVIELDPAKTLGIGGEIEIDANYTRSTAGLASYQQIGSYQFDTQYGLFAVCRNPTTLAPAYTQSSCLLRGIGGEYDSATLQVSWKRKFIDPLGEVWTPFTFARANLNYLNANATGSTSFSRQYWDPATNSYQTVTDTISNANQSNFLSKNDQFGGYVTPGVGLEWRYPLLSKTPIGDIVIEPIAQVIGRPNGQPTNNMVNLDAQSLVFDDSSLFEWNKYSGYDRFETGVRANYGAQFTYDAHAFGVVSGLFGQSVQLAGVNAYATPDAANIGLSSGLDTPWSDYVGRLAYTLNSNYSLIAKARFDQADWTMRRLDIEGRAKYGPVTFGVNYANYTAQPLIGYNERREGLGLNTRYDVFQNYYLQGDITWDLGRHNYNGVEYFAGYNSSGQPVFQTAPSAPLFAIATWGAGFGYQDECVKLGLAYRDSISDAYGYPPSYNRNKSVIFTLDLRTLGDIRAPFSLTPSVIQDGVRVSTTY
jgi:LPS-assembly protein